MNSYAAILQYSNQALCPLRSSCLAAAASAHCRHCIDNRAVQCTAVLQSATSLQPSGSTMLRLNIRLQSSTPLRSARNRTPACSLGTVIESRARASPRGVFPLLVFPGPWHHCDAKSWIGSQYTSSERHRLSEHVCDSTRSPSSDRMTNAM